MSFVTYVAVNIYSVNVDNNKEDYLEEIYLGRIIKYHNKDSNQGFLFKPVNNQLKPDNYKIFSGNLL